jgi:hypothetical protein
MIARSTRACALMSFALMFPLSHHALANHGPGTSGGGSATASGETLKAGRFELSLREDYTKFRKVNAEQAESIALESGEFDAIQESYLTTGSLAYGITDDFQIGAILGYYKANNFIDAEAEDGVAESSAANPDGITDFAVSAKYRVLRGYPGNLSVIAGAIAPTGRNDVLLASGESLEPSSQPGTGEWGCQLGLAWSRFLTSRITADVSGIYTVHFENDNFKVGDRMDLGVAFAYRITESIRHFPNYSFFVECNSVWLGKDSADGVLNPNSGGWTVYLTPGARVRLSSWAALTVAPSFPILQETEGEQIKSRFKLAVTLSFSF